SELLRREQLQRRDVTLALVGHGTRRHPESRTTTLQLAETLKRRRVTGDVIAGFLDDEPGIESLLERASRSNLVVVPFLIGGSTHVEEDIPRRLSASDPERRVIVDRAVGAYPDLVELVIDLGRRHVPRPVLELRPRTSVSGKKGQVYLVGAGPGDPGLITVRGLELLRTADVVVHDRLIPTELLDQAPAAAQLIDAGKSPGHQARTQAEINALLVSHARAGRRVIRLKGGDPFVFGRGSEEVDACREAGIQVEVVPGISSAIGGPAAAGIPVTARGLSSSFTVITGHVAGAADNEGTLVLLMARSKLAGITRKLIAEGRDPETPAACVQSATTPQERVVRGTLATIADAADREGLEAPVVTVIGAVAALGADWSKDSLRERVSLLREHG
ncbi:MAG TPA: uroporphyrinogen-III C-methyltransferase, partial [Gemmatimonadales bacterium]